MTVLIPAYEPDQRLLQLIRQLKLKSLNDILIVDDGSGDAYRPIFDLAEAEGCKVLRHPTNLGKGRALKTGFRYLQQEGAPDGVICADSDGQHLPDDILRVGEALEEENADIVLGGRRFSGKVPLRSRIGNAVTRAVYAFVTGERIYDTQTGLRGYSPRMLEWLCGIPGDRFEYEMNLLLAAHKEGVKVLEIGIGTVYLDENRSSHFRPLEDSFRVYLPIVLFSASSLISALLDFSLLLLLQHLAGNLFISVAGARLCSSIFNYAVNRSMVFRKPSGAAVSRSLPKYFTLVLMILLLNYGFMFAYHAAAGIPLVLSKLLTEATLFLFSYWAQRKYVY